MARTPLVSLVPCVFLTLSLIGCAGNEPPAQSPEAPPPPAAAPASEKSAASAPAGTDDAWEGEAEAKSGAPGGAADGKGAETRTNEVIAKVIKDNRKPFRDCF